MDLAELEVLISLAQEGSFSRAAESLHRSQPAVSQAIRRLEDEVQAQLMDRTSRKVVLTAAGTALLGYARRMVALREDAKRSLDELRQKLRRGGSVKGLSFGVPRLRGLIVLHSHPKNSSTALLCASFAPSA